MTRCRRCGIETPRLTVNQTHCPQCERQVRAIIEADARRRTRFAFAKDTTGVAA